MYYNFYLNKIYYFYYYYCCSYFIFFLECPNTRLLLFACFKPDAIYFAG